MLKNKEKDLITSIILGDGGIYKQKDYNSYYIYVGHGKDQKDYCEWKMNLLNQSKLFDTPITMHTKEIQHYNGKKYIQYFFKKCGFFLKFIYDKTIVDDVKTIYELLPMLKTTRGVAIWFMDDGSVEEGRWKDKYGNKHTTRPNIKLCTHSFSYEENIYIQKWFKQKYNLECNIKEEVKRHKDGSIKKKYYYLRFDVDNSEYLYKNILKEYVKCCKSMEYKFRHCIEKFG